MNETIMKPLAVRITGNLSFTVMMLMVAALLGPFRAQASDVDIVRNDEFKQTHYCVTRMDCRLCWETYQTELNRGIVKSRSRCEQPLEAQLPGLSRLLSAIVSPVSGESPLHTLFWGRLSPDHSQDDLEMSKRLALAAFRSPAWDNQHGRPAQGHSNDAVRKLANDATIFVELRSLFAEFGYQIRVSAVEKVLVTAAHQLPFFGALASQGIGKDDRLPYDCLIWFSIGPEKN